MASFLLRTKQIPFNCPFRPHEPKQPIRSTGFLRIRTSQQRLQSIVARGILDTYRRDQAVAEAQRASKSEDRSDEETCPAECVKDIFTVEDLDDALEGAGENTLVVVDFFKTACGSCRYIQPGFVKLCRASEERHSPVVFLRHNIFDEYEELSDLSQKFKIRAVPLFYFFKNGEVVEKFATRERRRIAKAINTHAGYEVLDPN
ncbi:g4903 [Coccomyxa elongata]